MRTVILSVMKWSEESFIKTDSFLRCNAFRMTFFFLLLSVFGFAQEKEFILTDIQTQQHFKAKDSAAAVKFLDSLSQHHYYLTELKEVKTEGDKTIIFFDKGRNFNEANVKISDSLSKALRTNTSFYTKNLDSLKKSFNQKFVEKGFTFSRVKSKFLGFENNVPQVALSVSYSKKRTIDGFVFKGYEKLPKRFVKNLVKDFKGKNYDEKNLVSINQSLQNHPFIVLEKPPQTLFTKDSTQIFLFTQKKRSNTFDGIIGFGNDKTEKFTFNGTLNVDFRNMFNGFEEINLYWQRNPDKGQTFDLKTDIPYLFKSNVGLNVNMNIYRQDSTFATVKFMPSVYYHINRNQRFGVRGTFETSSVIDTLYVQGKDYSKKGAGLWYQFTEPTEIELFRHKTFIRAEADFLSANYAEQSLKASQTKYFITAERNFNIKGNNYLNLRGETAMLKTSENLLENELLRFGGWNSMRGFNENSLIGDFYIFGGAEYRYLIGEKAFFDIFGQYSQVNNKLLSEKPKLYSIGLGFHFFLPIGLMSFQISNGNQFGNAFKFSDTKIHWGILGRF